MTVLKKYYEEIISKYEQRINYLERELAEKNLIIQKINQDPADI